MFNKRLFGFIIGYLFTSNYFHSVKVFAMGIQLQTTAGRLGAVGFGLVILVLLMFVFKRLFSASFFHGFLVATGLFLSFDIVVFHWFFHLHRITNGPEANWLEPIFVVLGICILVYGIKKERK